MGVFGEGNTNFYKLAPKPEPPVPEPTPVPPPLPPLPSPPPVKDRRRRRERYIPESRYSKPKSTAGGDFAVKTTGEDYKGPYIKTFDGKYYSGNKPEENGVELEELKPSFMEDLMPIALPTLGLVAGFFLAKLKKGDRAKGVTKRYFVQDKRTNKITETDLQTYQEAQKLPSKRFAFTDWIIKGPAEDAVIKGYPFEGAASKNRKAILKLEKDMPGISKFITDYSFQVEEIANPIDNQLSSQTIVIQDPLIELENNRKARFDLRK
jgi:hypothetical protein